MVATPANSLFTVCVFLEQVASMGPLLSEAKYHVLLIGSPCLFRTEMGMQHINYSHERKQ